MKDVLQFFHRRINACLSLAIWFAVGASLFGVCPSLAFAQFPDTPIVPPVINDPGINNGPTQDSSFNPDGQLNLNDVLQQFDPTPEPVEFENERLQPFVGRSLARYGEQELYHPRSNINSGASTGGANTGGRGGQFGQNRNSLQQGAGSMNEIVRRSLRTRVVPRIVVNFPVSSEQVSIRFGQRLSRMPITGDVASGVNVRVEGKTAILSGRVRTADERMRVERMARMEPGIYRIDNQIEVLQ